MTLYTLSDLCVSNNLIGLLSLTMTSHLPRLVVNIKQNKIAGRNHKVFWPRFRIRTLEKHKKSLKRCSF